MILDSAERIIRYVELDASGEPCAENFVAGVIGGKSEEEAFAALVVSAAKTGHMLVRLCNHDDCANPVLEQIEGDGKGGIRASAEHPEALAAVELWDAAQHERKFLTVPIEGTDHEMVVRMEPGQATAEQLRDGEFYVDHKGLFQWKRKDSAPPKGVVPGEESFRKPRSGSFR